jgi:hypothetical protein
MVLMSTPASAHVLLLLMGCTGGRGGMNTYATPCSTCSKQAFARAPYDRTGGQIRSLQEEKRPNSV